MRLRRVVTPSKQRRHSLQELIRRAAGISINPQDALELAGELLTAGTVPPADGKRLELRLHGLPVVADPRVPPGLAAIVSRDGNQLELIRL